MALDILRTYETNPWTNLLHAHLFWTQRLRCINEASQQHVGMYLGGYFEMTNTNNNAVGHSQQPYYTNPRSQLELCK